MFRLKVHLLATPYSKYKDGNETENWNDAAKESVSERHACNE